MLVVCRVLIAADIATTNAVVQQPRAFGYVIGDIATQRVLLEANGQPFTPAELPATGPAGNWVERRAVRTESDAEGHRWLAVDYQIMNSPQALTAVTLPAWKLTETPGGGELRVPEWPITVAPLTPRQPFARGGLGDLRPDRAAALVDVAPMRRWIAIWLSAFVASIAAWIGWWAWRNWRASSAQPFARALRELRGLDDGSPQAWHALHRAFDGTAGRVVQADALGGLFERAPQFEPQRLAIERFFAQSAARFFGTPPLEGANDVAVRDSPRAATPAAPLDASNRAPSVRALCAELRRIEKRHEP
jgi:mxaA protein